MSKPSSPKRRLLELTKDELAHLLLQRTHSVNTYLSMVLIQKKTLTEVEKADFTDSSDALAELVKEINQRGGLFS